MKNENKLRSAVLLKFANNKGEKTVSESESGITQCCYRACDKKSQSRTIQLKIRPIEKSIDRTLFLFAFESRPDSIVFADE